LALIIRKAFQFLKSCFLVHKAQRGDQVFMAQITLRDYLQETEDAISSSHLDEALTRCQLMLSYFPEALEIQRLLGEVYLAQGQIEEAQQVFDWVLTNDPENVVAYCNRADVSERMSEYDVALDCYQQAYELSRGNGQIREEFNRLSEKVGQKGFMFSRAGLARLYMRGDALSDAIQEWEAVLAVTPDRLDARTGLLETYWRAGLMENVEQLAEEILRTVHGCLKALLLQASAISSKDSQRLEELLRRAEALDPDYITAQALFADALASHPDDPFLRQVKKAPVLLPDEQAIVHVSAQETMSMPSSQTTHTESKELSLEPWELLQDALNQIDAQGASPLSPASPMAPYAVPLWENLPSSVEPIEPSLDLSPLASPLMPTQQESTSSPSLGSDPWGVPMQEPIAPAAENIPTPPPNWLDILAQPDTATRRSDPYPLTLESQSDNGLSLVNSSLEQLVQLNTRSLEAQNPESFIFPPPSQESAQGTPPTENAEPQPTWLKSAEVEMPESQPSWSKSVDLDKVEDDGESLFSPSWLKSLGATTLADEEFPATDASLTFATEAQTQQVAQSEYTDPQGEEYYTPPFAQQGADHMQVLSAEYAEAQTVSPPIPGSAQGTIPTVPETVSYESWSQGSLNTSPNIEELTSWTPAEVPQQSYTINYETGSLYENAYASGTASPPPPANLPAEQPIQQDGGDKKAEQNLFTTLEELEQSLRSKGFIQLEPNSLSALAGQMPESSAASYYDPDIAQTPESLATSYNPDISTAPEVHDAQDFQQSAYRQEPQEQQETFEDPSLSSALAQLGNFIQEPPAPTPPSLASSLEMFGQNDEPSWLQALKSTSTTPTVPVTPTVPEPYVEPFAPAAYADNFPQTPPVQAEPTRTASYNPTQPVEKELQETVKAPAMQGNPLLDLEGELETTMRRPAVRLQGMQRPTSPSRRPEGSYIVSRSQSGEHIEKAAKTIKPTNENLSYHDRLVKGYQCQLVGDYDEAMQEYRVIIRSGTNLLNEVVSNVRALLKLAPNYSAGYRILGDAYMRQGEYLQAMEAYNKALTMTKKVKSRA
jgi:tetratricopeptide (TPR) repeat protein